MLPAIALIIPVHIMYKAMGLTDSYIGLIIMRDHRRDREQRGDDGPGADPTVEEEGQPEPQQQLRHQRRRDDDRGVPHRGPEPGVVEERLRVVLQATYWWSGPMERSKFWSER
jgi:hypothetical protein